eukprot:CAMPEP_0198241206 /NCGR_PEP_ID=MMETSP1446-20131203/6073_1 /TAXON_ID=1461542 ORGANISM="Unidentified sp, Strain CCMP2111" /NCGR_SAMPLE_ID=MMETSP1446 /ASSEMBLY_ACC=CAM_ASM_001112 /LENGTH=440 /DNA_ID=CAMNT_0043924011 /DNA_START=313 /DNA_END=1635 /DNA_ORIENTATION=+
MAVKGNRLDVRKTSASTPTLNASTSASSIARVSSQGSLGTSQREIDVATKWDQDAYGEDVLGEDNLLDDNKHKRSAAYDIEAKRSALSISLGARKRRGGKRICWTFVLPTFVCICLLSVGILIGYNISSGVKQVTPYMDAMASEEYGTRFLVVGDWGRQGMHNQADVAMQMGLVGEVLRPQFVVSTGDNFYPSGLKSANDSLFLESFTDVYSGPSLQVDWYSILGNHDYGDASALGDTATRPSFQTTDQTRGKDSRWICCGGREFRKQSTDLVDMFFIDTTPFVEKYYETAWANVEGGLVDEKSKRGEQISNFNADLVKSQARWKIVFGHHPVRSNGSHGDTKELVELLSGTLRGNGVDMYINGHDHILQDIPDKENPSLHYITSGAGSKIRLGLGACCNDKDFYAAKAGFIAVALSDTRARIQFWHYDATLAHETVLIK